MSTAPIAISNRTHSRKLSALPPWSIDQTTTVDEQPTAQIQVSPAAFNFKMASPPVASLVPETAFYDPCVVEQQHCTGYECCNLKLGDMHAVMDHYEQAHRVSRFGNTSFPVPRLPVFQHQPIVIPLVSHLDTDIEMASAPSPASTTTSDRSRSLSIPDDAEFELDLDSDPRTPQTPPALHPSQNITIVSHNGEPDGLNPFQYNNLAFSNSSPFQQHFVPQKQPAYPTVGIPQPPLLSATTPAIRRSVTDLSRRPAAEMRFPQQSHAIDCDVDMMGETHDTSAFPLDARQQTAYYQSPVVVPNPVYPQRRPQIARQNSMHVTPNPTMPTPQRSHSFAETQSQPFPLRPAEVSFAQPRPLAPSPSPTLQQPQFDTQPRPVAPRSRNASQAFQPIVPPTLYSPSKRSYEEAESPLSDGAPEDDARDDDDDEDAEGELETMPTLGPAIIDTPIAKPATTPRKSSTANSTREKRAKTGRPKGTGRASAQKDPKRARLFCPRPGCTKRLARVGRQPAIPSTSNIKGDKHPTTASHRLSPSLGSSLPADEAMRHACCGTGHKVSRGGFTNAIWCLEAILQGKTLPICASEFHIVGFPALDDPAVRVITWTIGLVYGWWYLSGPG
ncbi:hypothetical protein FRB99_006082 [Tulasnella sp. 403]|nr:hypothetical protein FRB99_006082 [Tulasnella sp. 403]